MEGTSTSEARQEISEACEIYANITNLLLNKGYESLLEEIDTRPLTDSMLAVLKVLNTLEQICDEKSARPSKAYQENMQNIQDYMMRKTIRTPTPKKLHSRDLHKIYLDKHMGTIDPAKLKNFIKTYQTQKFLHHRDYP